MEKQLWTSEELKDLMNYAREMQTVNEDLRAQNMALLAKLNNEEAKVRWCKEQMRVILNKNR